MSDWSGTDWRMTLYNWLQGRHGTTKYLSYAAEHDGPEDAGEWVVTAYSE
jgi:hypothetical protein